MSDLASKQCVPCKGGVPPLTEPQYKPLLAKLEGWRVEKGHHLHKDYPFPDFVTALAHVNRIGDVAEEQGHHPDIQLTWGRVGVSIWTHKIDGLTESDFILAAKLDQLPR
jgi:4a-hydroxytetrahydrobiopterin dehydratase